MPCDEVGSLSLPKFTLRFETAIFPFSIETLSHGATFPEHIDPNLKSRISGMHSTDEIQKERNDSNNIR